MPTLSDSPSSNSPSLSSPSPELQPESGAQPTPKQSKPPATLMNTLMLSELLQGDDEQFVRHAYHAILGRGADPGGLETYMSLLSSGKSRVEVLNELLRSSEGIAHGAHIAGLDAAKSLVELLAHENHAFVSCAYQTLLVRFVDAGALDQYVLELSRGMARLQILREIRSSEECKSREALGHEMDLIAQRQKPAPLSAAGKRDDDDADPDSIAQLPSSLAQLVARNDRQFIHGLYQLLLGRAADAGGLENYLSRLSALASEGVDSATSREEILRGISLSGERKSRQSMFAEFDFAINDFLQEDRPLLGWMAARRRQKRDQLVNEQRLVAMGNQIVLMRQNFQRQLEQMKEQLKTGAGVHFGNVMQQLVERKPALKLSQLSPRARDIYFQLKNGRDERKQGGV